MMKQRILGLLLLTLALVTGLGALSDSLTHQIIVELQIRQWRNLVWRDMYAPLSQDAAEIFQARSDAYGEAVELVTRAAATGSTAPTVTP